VARIFPALLAAYAEFAQRHPGRGAVALHPSAEIRDVLAAILRRDPLPPGVRVELRPTGSPVGAAAVLTSSGTMSMHCALAGIPGAIAYRANPVTYLLGRWLVQVPYLGIANLLLGEAMYPEYLQGAARADRLAGELAACLDDPGRQARSAEQARRLQVVLRQPATGTAADWLERHLAPD
jgi:lipid-A-disaccharide synthase